MDIILVLIFLILVPFILIAAAKQRRHLAKQRRHLKEWGVPSAVEIAGYQEWVSPYRLMNQAHLTKTDAQFLLREACKQGLLYQVVNGRYYLGPPPASPAWSSHKTTTTYRCVKELYAPDRTRRLFIIQRDDGLVTFREDKSSFDDHSSTYFWEQSYASGLYDTAAAAENDARMIIPWLKALTH